VTAEGPPIYHFKSVIPIAGALVMLQGLLQALAPDAAEGALGDLFAGGACPAGARAYELASNAFMVTAWPGGPVPRSYTSEFEFIQDNGSARICDRCTFRPWAVPGQQP
ncbi:MAG: hypothetical protein L0099_08840, partial [Acidobacteria bacterium]|nr:hypothetical protein [Acidobacteriota bacterium]